VVSVVGKGGTKTRQVRSGETSASEPLMTCRNSQDDVETGGKVVALGCAKKKKKERCKLHAVREMRVGPSKPFCRERLQTATSCCGTMAMVVNVVVKRRG